MKQFISNLIDYHRFIAKFIIDVLYFAFVRLDLHTSDPP